MENITRIGTSQGYIYLTKRDKSKLEAYTRELKEYEKTLFKKYGKEFMLRITPAEYRKALRLHDQVFDLKTKILRGQAAMVRKLTK